MAIRLRMSSPVPDRNRLDVAMTSKRAALPRTPRKLMKDIASTQMITRVREVVTGRDSTAAERVEIFEDRFMTFNLMIICC